MNKEIDWIKKVTKDYEASLDLNWNDLLYAVLNSLVGMSQYDA